MTVPKKHRADVHASSAGTHEPTSKGQSTHRVGRGRINQVTEAAKAWKMAARELVLGKREKLERRPKAGEMAGGGMEFKEIVNGTKKES